ncbi:acyl carrier protein, partial [Burkholderia ubonensis]|uniref:acyl carrier protein n=1 Tax=Burkholderia ubonensis TaxID=101571 RepID=UPI000A52B85D
AQRQVGLRSALSTTAELNAWAERNGAEIGSIEQTVSGPRQLLDPLFRAETDTPLDPDTPDESAGEGISSAANQVTIEPMCLFDRELVHSVEKWLITWLSERLKHRRLSLTRESTFTEIGFDSILAVELTTVFSETFSMTVDAAAVWDYPSIRKLATHLAAQILSCPSAHTEMAAHSTATHTSTL